MDTHATRGCFIGYTGTDMIHKTWDFERKCFANSHDLHFDKMQFLEPSDFNEPPADTYDAYHRNQVRDPVLANILTAPALAPMLTSLTTMPVSSRELSPEPEPPHLYDEIIIQPPSALQAFKSYTKFQHNDSPSFADVMWRPDTNL